jgi:hypothetical protein
MRAVLRAIVTGSDPELPGATLSVCRGSLLTWVRSTVLAEQPRQHFQQAAVIALAVTACGRICMHRKKINISTVLAGQRLGIKEVDDGIWIVSFMRYDLGYIDLEQRTLQPLDNPFGPRLSPMS